MSQGDQPTVDEDAWTVARVLAWATSDFRARGLESARLDAELLLAHSLGTDRLRLILDASRPLDGAELSAYRALIVRRRKREPIAYILGHREFYGLPFRVDSRVLIPRQDTEMLVEVALTRTRSRDLHGRALDLCTGSGCVAIAFALARPTWSVAGGDISADAIHVARDNALRLGAASTARFLTGDLFEACADPQRFDLVTANPPYVTQPDMASLDADIRGFEPHLALNGGHDGLDVVRRIVEGSRARLTAGGVLALELGYDQAERTHALLDAAGFRGVERKRDYGGHERVVSGVAPG